MWHDIFGGCKSGFSRRASGFVNVALNTPRRGFNAILTGREAVRNCNVCMGIRWQITFSQNCMNATP